MQIQPATFFCKMFLCRAYAFAYVFSEVSVNYVLVYF